MSLARKEMRFAGAVIFILFLCIIGWILIRAQPEPGTFKTGRASQLTSEAGLEIDPAVSPDGKMLAYSSYFRGNFRVFVKQMSGGRALCLTGEMAGHQRFPSWSLDGSEIAFCSSTPTLVLYLVPALGGASRKIADGVRGYAWSPSGKQIVCYRGRDTISVQLLDGSESRTLSVVPSPHSFCWSPDGSSIALVSGNWPYLESTNLANIAPSSIYVLTLSDGRLLQVTDNSFLNVSPAWSSDSRHLLFVSNRDGTRDIYQISLGNSGKELAGPERLTAGLNAHTIALSADSRTLVYSVLTHSNNVWSVRIPTGGPASVKEATQVTTGNQVIEGLAISPDRQWLAYDSNREGNQDIFKVSMKGGDPIRLTTDSSDDFQPNWSPDGKWIAFYSFRRGNRDLFIMPADGGQQQQITRDPDQDSYPDWSPDGNQLVFNSRKTKRQELHLVSKSQSGNWEEPRQLTFDGGLFPRWSPDGKFIAYIGVKKLCIISPNGGDPAVLVESRDPDKTPEPAFPAWSSDSKTVYYKALDGELRSSIWAVSISGGTRRLLVRFDDPFRQSSRQEFATDGKRLFFTVSNYESDIWKMELIAGQ